LNIASVNTTPAIASTVQALSRTIHQSCVRSMPSARVCDCPGPPFGPGIMLPGGRDALVHEITLWCGRDAKLSAGSSGYMSCMRA
jgi:hypothetical protein